MFNEEFYPTPIEVAMKMYECVNPHERRILEPSCGKGDLIAPILEGDVYYSSLSREDCDTDEEFEEIKAKRYHVKESRPEIVYGIELVPELQAIAKEKGIYIIGDDFLDTDIDHSIDLIYMNPPFSNGDEHLLRAWEIIEEGGDIVCLLNLETVRNPYTKRRELLNNIIQKHGTTSMLGACFANSERPTNVQVVMVHLKKPENEYRFKFEQKLHSDPEMDKENIFDLSGKDITYTNQLAKSDLLGALEDAYNSSTKVFTELLKSVQATKELYNTFNNYDSERFKIEDFIQKDPKESYKVFKETMKRRAWKYVINKTNIDKYATSRVRQMISDFSSEQSAMAFTKKNVIKFLEMLILNSEQIFMQAVKDVFTVLTKYDKENTIHWEGWKTNDAYKINFKVIIPNVFSYDNTYSIERYRWNINKSTFLEDIDIAMSYVTKRPIEETFTLAKAIEAVKNGRLEGTCSYFAWKAFKKGTLHIWFKHEEYWHKFNIIGAVGLGWLPASDIKSKEAEMQGRKNVKQYAKAYWVKQEQEAEAIAKRNKAMEIVFFPCNERGQAIRDLFESYGCTTNAYPNAVNVLIVKRGELKLELIDNTGELLIRVTKEMEEQFKVCDKNIYLHENYKIYPIEDILSELRTYINDEMDTYWWITLKDLCGGKAEAIMDWRYFYLNGKEFKMATKEANVVSSDVPGIEIGMSIIDTVRFIENLSK